LDFLGCSFISEADYRAARAGNSAPQRGDVLFSKDGTVGKVHVVDTDQPFAVLSSLAILRPKGDSVDTRYFGHVLRSPGVLDDALKRKTGSAIRRVILSDLKKVRILLPPLPEQRRIAEILDKADALRAKRRAVLAQLNTAPSGGSCSHALRRPLHHHERHHRRAHGDRAGAGVSGGGRPRRTGSTAWPCAKGLPPETESTPTIDLPLSMKLK
jgi:hypothetical protein